MSDSEEECEDFKSGEHVEVEIDEDRDLMDEYGTFQEFEDDFKRWQRETYQTFTIAKSDRLPAGHALKDDIVYQDIKADDDTDDDDKADADADSVFSDVVSDVDVDKTEELIPTKAKLVVVGKSKGRPNKNRSMGQVRFNNTQASNNNQGTKRSPPGQPRISKKAG